MKRADTGRLILVVGAVVFLDTLFYSVVSPLLPQLSHHLHLSKFSAGVLTGSYAAGTLIASIPGGILATRLGPRFTVCTGLTLMALSTVGFGWLNSAFGLDVARFIEGVGGACSWAGGLAWIVAEAPAQRRGEMIGKAMGAAIGGALFGPAIGAFASAAGRPTVFTLVAVLSVGLILVTGRLPHTGKPSRQGLEVIWKALKRPRFLLAMWLMTVPAMISGLFNLLGPLRLHEFGASALVIGGTYVVAAAAEALVSPLMGQISDKRGRLLPLRASLVLGVVVLSVFTIPQTVPLVAVVLLASTLMLGGFWAPSMALISDVAASDGLDQALAAALMNLGWAGGAIIGPMLGGAAAKSFGDAVPMLCGVALCAGTLTALAFKRVSAGIDGLHGADATPDPVHA